MSQAKSKEKEKIEYINLCLPARKATPGPPIGPAFGQKGVSGAEFSKQFNEATKKMEEGTPVRVRVSVIKRTFTFQSLGSPVSYYLKKFANLIKGSSKPGRTSAGTIAMEDVRNIAEIKMKEGLSARDLDNAVKIIAGSARSMGLKVLKEDEQ